MKTPFNIKKLASYLKDRQLMVYATEEHLLIGESSAMFQVERHKDLAACDPGVHGKAYIKARDESDFLEEHIHNPSRLWEGWSSEFIDTHIVYPKDYFYQPFDGFLVRKFTNRTPETPNNKVVTVWINKRLTDILAPMEIDLDYHFRWEMLYKPGDPLQIQPVRVSFRKQMSDEWKIVAFFMPFNHKE
jgi:hypothetical protein